jgi:predicted MFS family arabinose efflux permease
MVCSQLSNFPKHQYEWHGMGASIGAALIVGSLASGRIFDRIRNKPAIAWFLVICTFADHLPVDNMMNVILMCYVM